MWTSALGIVATTEGEAVLNLLVQTLKIAGSDAIMGLLTTVIRSIGEHASDVVAFAEKLAAAEETLSMLTQTPLYRGAVDQLLRIVWKILAMPIVNLGRIDAEGGGGSPTAGRGASESRWSGGANGSGGEASDEAESPPVLVLFRTLLRASLPQLSFYITLCFREIAASAAAAETGESFMYRYILRESCSQFDSLPLTSLNIIAKGRARASPRSAQSRATFRSPASCCAFAPTCRTRRRPAPRCTRRRRRGRYGVSQLLLSTVTLCANLAHSLTRSR